MLLVKTLACTIVQTFHILSIYYLAAFVNNFNVIYAFCMQNKPVCCLIKYKELFVLKMTFKPYIIIWKEINFVLKILQCFKLLTKTLLTLPVDSPLPDRL